MNTLLLTSCNRIKQVLLSLTLNSHIVKNPFNVVITDCSSLNTPFNIAIQLDHDTTKITTKSYCSDITLFEKHISLLYKIKTYKIIHHFPKMNKHGGESTLIKLGLSQVDSMNTSDIDADHRGCSFYNEQITSRLNDSFCLKLTGVSILNYDIISKLPSLLKQHDIFTFKKLYQRELVSTRIFGCRPNILNSLIDKTENMFWTHEPHQFVEIKFNSLLKNHDINKIMNIDSDESEILFDRACSLNRKSILMFIKNNNIPIDYPIIQEFLDGDIYD